MNFRIPLPTQPNWVRYYEISLWCEPWGFCFRIRLHELRQRFQLGTNIGGRMKKVKLVAAKSLSVQQETDIFVGVLAAFENFIHQPLLTVGEQEAHAKTGAFPYIPLPLNQFLEQLFKARSILNPDWVSQRYAHPQPSFIDVGCGIGTKVLIARQFRLDYCGIEINKKYVEAARRLLGDYTKKTILQGDARKHNYSPYDIIYFYCPMRTTYKKDKQGNCTTEIDKTNELTLEERIITTAKVGAVILANLHNHDAFRDPTKWGLKSIDHNTFQKVKEIKR